MFGRTDGWMIYMDDVLRFNGVRSHKLVYTTHALVTLYITHIPLFPVTTP